MKKEDIALKCRDMAELVTPYLEGGLPFRKRLAARFHLRLCAACRNYVEQVRRTISFLGSGPPPKPPENENEIIASLGSRLGDGR
jgi:hypothetical protein